LPLTTLDCLAGSASFAEDDTLPMKEALAEFAVFDRLLTMALTPAD